MPRTSTSTLGLPKIDKTKVRNLMINIKKFSRENERDISFLDSLGEDQTSSSDF